MDCTDLSPDHKPSRTMIEADLLFNLPATEQFSKSGTDPRSGILTNDLCGNNEHKR